MKYGLIFLVTLACVLIATEATPTQVCEPGSVFKKDCNECKCNTEGTDMACTRKMCTGDQDGAEPVPETAAENAENKEETRAERQAVDDDTCTPGETYKKDCNDCTCPPSGRKSAGACTLLACFDEGVQKE